MSQKVLRKLSALVAAALVIGCADAPTMVKPGEVGLRTSSSPLSVAVTCYNSYRYEDDPPGQIWCEATASGGSGTGYSFTSPVEWGEPFNFTVHHQGGNYALVSIDCPDFDFNFGTSVYVSVTDSNGGSAEGYDSATCVVS